MNDHERLLRASVGLGYTAGEHTTVGSPVVDWLGAVWPWSIAGALVGAGVAAFSKSKKRKLGPSAGLGGLAGTAVGSVAYVLK